MDYSTASNDLGTSPWAAAASSPQPRQSGFETEEQQLQQQQQQPSQTSSTISDLQSPENQHQQQRFTSASESPFAGVFRDNDDTDGAADAAGDGGFAQNKSYEGMREGGSQPYSSRHEYHQENSQSGDRQYQGDGRREAQQPQQQQGQPGQQQQQQQQQRSPQYKLQAKVTGLERTGRKDSILRFDVYTNLPKFRTTQFRDVRRTHSEFLKLGEHLISANPEALVPAVPAAVTSAGAGTEEDETRVKASIQRWLNAVCGNSVLARDEEVQFFVESDFGYSPVVRHKQPATGVRRKVLKQFAPPPDDTPELARARPIVKMFYLGAMEAGQKTDRVVRARRALGASEADHGQRISQLSVQETHSGLAHAYRKLGKALQTVGDSHVAQGTAEATTFLDPIQYHTTSAFIAKETLTNRHILQRELIQAQQATRNRLAAADRLKSGTSTVRSDKVDEAITLLDEAREHETMLTNKTRRVTQHLLAEQERWFERTSTEMRDAVREYVGRQIDAERRTLATLEAVRPDIRSIDGSGGLSRLGREKHPLPPTAAARMNTGSGLNSSVLGSLGNVSNPNTPVPRRSVLASSQGPRGDAWSGIPRRSADKYSSSNAAPNSNSNVKNSTANDSSASSSCPSSSENDDDDDEDKATKSDAEPQNQAQANEQDASSSSKNPNDRNKNIKSKSKTKKQQHMSSSNSGMTNSISASASASFHVGASKEDDEEEDDEDRIDARNAASRLATTTF